MSAITTSSLADWRTEALVNHRSVWTEIHKALWVARPLQWAQ